MSLEKTDGAGAEERTDVHMLLKIVILGVIGLVSVVGNGIALGTLIIYNRSLRVTIYIVIGGLALADIVVSVMNVPDQIISYAEKGDLKSDTWCKFYGFLYNSCQYIAAFHLVVLGVLRGILLTDRANHGPTALHALITSVILWLISLLANIPMVSSSNHHLMSKQCVVAFNKDEETGTEKIGSSAEELYRILSAAFSYFLPLLLIIIIYLFTGYMSKRFFEDSYSRRERRMSKMISSLIVTFALFRLPSETVNLLLYYQYKNKNVLYVIETERETFRLHVWLHVRDYLQILSMFDMAIRPIIYATMSREFGFVYDKVINCTYCKEEEEEELPPRLRRRGHEIEEVLHTPLRQNTEIQEFPNNEPEEIF